MKKMLSTALLILLPSIAMADPSPTPSPPPTKVSREHLLEIRVIQLEEEVVKLQTQLTTAQHDATKAELRRIYQIADADEIRPDGTIVRAPKPEKFKLASPPSPQPPPPKVATNSSSQPSKKN